MKITSFFTCFFANLDNCFINEILTSLDAVNSMLTPILFYFKTDQSSDQNQQKCPFIFHMTKSVHLIPIYFLGLKTFKTNLSLSLSLSLCACVCVCLTLLRVFKLKQKIQLPSIQGRVSTGLY